MSVSAADRELEFLGKGSSPTLVGMYFVTGKDGLGLASKSTFPRETAHLDGTNCTGQRGD